MPVHPGSGPLTSALLALGDLVLPVRCGGCDRPGQAWCAVCEAELAAAPPAARWRPTPEPDGLPEVWSVLPYQGAARACLVNWKDNGRRDLTRVLAPVLTEAVLAALLGPPGGRGLTTAVDPGEARRGARAGAGHARSSRLVVPVPSGRRNVRRRGDRPLVDLTHQALRSLPTPLRLPVVPALRLTRTVVDQAGLRSGARAENLRGAMGLSPSAAGAVQGACCLVVDDVITTGATLTEAARVLRAAGASEVLAVTVAATRRRGQPLR